MKRATLTAYTAKPPAEPEDLTDRLLEREENTSASAPSKRRARPAKTGHSGQAKPAEPEALATPTAAKSSVEMALASAEAATEALRQAAREAPARYDVALHYRLDALAHHLQQVREFVMALAAR
jgi:hypothetical protein